MPPFGGEGGGSSPYVRVGGEGEGASHSRLREGEGRGKRSSGEENTHALMFGAKGRACHTRVCERGRGWR